MRTLVPAFPRFATARRPVSGCEPGLAAIARSYAFDRSTEPSAPTTAAAVHAINSRSEAHSDPDQPRTRMAARANVRQGSLLRRRVPAFPAERLRASAAAERRDYAPQRVVRGVKACRRPRGRAFGTAVAAAAFRDHARLSERPSDEVARHVGTNARGSGAAAAPLAAAAAPHPLQQGMRRRGL